MFFFVKFIKLFLDININFLGVILLKNWYFFYSVCILFVNKKLIWLEFCFYVNNDIFGFVFLFYLWLNFWLLYLNLSWVLLKLILIIKNEKNIKFC